MKAFVIKNKEGKYFQWLFNDEPDWEDKLYNGFMHYSKEDAEKSIIQWQLENCEVVEITIEETKDLEKDFVSKNYHDVVVGNYKIALNGLEQQLIEKDKEIEEYKTQIKEFCGTKLAKLIDKKEQEIRHQVCDEIRKKSNSWNEDENGNVWEYHILESQLQEIEQGEQ